MTLTISLPASRTSSATVEGIESYNELINDTKAGLEDRLDNMDAKLELLLASDIGASHVDVDEVEQIRMERLSTEKCLQICAKVSDYIAQVQAETESCRPKDQSNEHLLPSESITSDGLEQCRDDLARTAKKLTTYKRELFRRMLEKSRTALEPEEGRTDLARLQDE